MSFACYLDDSYGEGATVITLGGYFGTIENWLQYELCAAKIYEAHGIQILHSKDLHSTKRTFKNWSLEKKRSLVQALFDAASAARLVGISFSVTKSLSDTFKSASPKTSQSSALGMLFGMLSFSVCDNDGLAEISGPRETSFVVETGNKNNAGILSSFNEMKERNQDPIPRVKSLTFVNKSDCFAIQLADFWAFYSRRIATKLLQNNFQGGDKFTQYIDRECVGAIATCPHTIKIVHGGVSSPLGEPNLLIAGQTETFHLGPMAKN
jgi:hypothetical protein